MGDQYLNDWLVTFIVEEVFLQVNDEDIISLFQKPSRCDSKKKPSRWDICDLIS
jgi:hypothetical protein